MDLNASNKGFYIPKYSLTSLTNNTNPINNPATGLLIYNTGTTHPEGLYYWTGNQWERFHVKGDFNEIISVTKNSGNIFTENTDPQTITGYNIAGNTLQGGSVNSTTGNITLPAGKYRVHIKLDATTNTSSSGYYTSTVNGTTIRTNNIAVRAVLTDQNNNELTTPQIYSNLSDGTILGFEYNFWLNLTNPTNTVRLRMNYDTLNSTGGISNEMRSHQSGLKVTFIKMQ